MQDEACVHVWELDKKETLAGTLMCCEAAVVLRIGLSFVPPRNIFIYSINKLVGYECSLEVTGLILCQRCNPKESFALCIHFALLENILSRKYFQCVSLHQLPLITSVRVKGTRCENVNL